MCDRIEWRIELERKEKETEVGKQDIFVIVENEELNERNKKKMEVTLK